MEHTDEPTYPFYLLRLKAELARRKSSNPRYSLRAFSRALAVESGVLSRILGRKRPLMRERAIAFADRLGLDDMERSRFVKSAEDEVARRLLVGPTTPAPEQPLKLANESFEVISDILHYAVLELTRNTDFVADSDWIGRRLGATREEVDGAIERLLKIGLLEREGGSLRKATGRLTTDDRQRTSEALKEHQRQALAGAVRALDVVPLARRHNFSVTMSVNPDKLPLARQLIEEFAAAICDALGTGAERAVYEMTIGLYPMTETAESPAVRPPGPGPSNETSAH